LSPVLDSDGSLALGQPAPDFDLPGADGRNHRLAEYRGAIKALCVIFSCNHCPMVIKYEERMIALGKEFQPKGVQFVLISANDVVKYPQDGPEPMKKRALDKGYPFPYLYDESQQVARAYGAQVTPHIFLFDGDLKLRYRGSIDDNPDRPDQVEHRYLGDAIQAILAGKADSIAAAKTHAVGCSVKWK